MKKKDNTALIDAFRKLSEAASDIADALDSTPKKSEPAEAPAKEAEAEPAKEPVKAEEPKATATDISFEDVRTALAAKAGEGHKAEVKEILSKHNAKCLSDLESHPEDFPEILKEAEAIGNE